MTGLFERFVHVRRQARADLDLIAPAVDDTVDAELVAFDGDGLRVLGVDGDELGEVHLTAGEVLGELNADARRGRVAESVE